MREDYEVHYSLCPWLLICVCEILHCVSCSWSAEYWCCLTITKLVIQEHHVSVCLSRSLFNYIHEQNLDNVSRWAFLPTILRVYCDYSLETFWSVSLLSCFFGAYFGVSAFILSSFFVQVLWLPMERAVHSLASFVIPPAWWFEYVFVLQDSLCSQLRRIFSLASRSLSVKLLLSDSK